MADDDPEDPGDAVDEGEEAGIAEAELKKLEQVSTNHDALHTPLRRSSRWDVPNHSRNHHHASAH